MQKQESKTKKKHTFSGITSTKGRQDWRTPDHFFNFCAFRFGPFTLDAAASRSNRKCKNFFDEHDNGLLQSWDGQTVWCNPPYERGSAKAWLSKAYDEMKSNGVKSALLLPVNTSTIWFHEFAVGKCSVYLVKRRLCFDDNKSSAPFCSMLCVFDPNEKPKIDVLDFKEFKQ